MALYKRGIRREQRSERNLLLIYTFCLFVFLFLLFSAIFDDFTLGSLKIHLVSTATSVWPRYHSGDHGVLTNVMLLPHELDSVSQFSQTESTYQDVFNRTFEFHPTQ